MPDSSRSRDPQVGFVFASLTAVMAFVLVAVGIIAVVNKDSGASSGATTVEVVLSEFKVTMTPATVPSGDVTLHVTNSGSQIHNVDVVQLAKKTPDIAPGSSATLELGTVPAGSYVVNCAIAGHTEAGMKATLVVGTASPGAAMPGMATSSGNPDDAVIDFAAAAPAGFTARDPNAPPPLPGTVHEIAMEASEAVIDVAAGVSQEMWTFNLAGEAPMVPGPVLRGNIGDTFRVTLTNKGKMDHSIDFHASKVAWDDQMRSIHPGESLVYEFTANYAGAFMYHCGTAPALHHIGNGMYGAIIIDPPALAPVDHEFVIVQSELYPGPAGEPGDLTKMTNNEWDAVVFNGFVNQYKFAPIRVEPGERVRVWVIDDGPSENSAFHIVGTIFDTVWKEGAYLLQPDATHGGSQVLDLQPAQGGFVEFTLAVKGLYPMITHKFSNVGKGALGLFQAGEVTAAPAAGH